MVPDWMPRCSLGQVNLLTSNYAKRWQSLVVLIPCAEDARGEKKCCICGTSFVDNQGVKRVLTALVVIPPVLAAVLWLRPWIFSLLVGILALIAVDEFLN